MNPESWPFAEWSVTMVGPRDSATHSPSGCFARIGSDPACEIRLEAQESPPFAYLLCALESTVEAWPLCKMEGAYSGPLEPETELRVGQHLFRVRQHSNGSETNRQIEEIPRLEFSRNGQHRLTTLTRPITIVGDDHPSIMRLRGVGLQPCHGAFIWQGGKVWYLSVAEHTASLSTRVLQAVESATRIQLGRVQVRILPFPNQDTVASVPDPQRKATNEETQLPERVASPGPSRAVSTVPVVPDTPKVPIEFSDDVMRRLVRLGRQRALPRRLLFLCVIFLLTLVALLIVARSYHEMRDALSGYFF